MVHKTYLPQDQVRVENPTQFTCPFCDGVATLGLIDGKPAALHTLPICSTYDKLDPLEFATLARKRLGN